MCINIHIFKHSCKHNHHRYVRWKLSHLTYTLTATETHADRFIKPRVSHTDPKDQDQCALSHHQPLDVAKSNAYTKFSAYFQRACLLLMNHSDQGPSAIPHYHLCSNTTSMQMENMEGFSDVANLRRFEEITRFTLEQYKQLIRQTFRYLSFKIYWSFSQLQIQNLSTLFSKSSFSSCLLSSSQGKNPNSSHFLTWSNSAASNLCPQIWLLNPHSIAKNSLETRNRPCGLLIKAICLSHLHLSGVVYIFLVEHKSANIHWDTETQNFVHVPRWIRQEMDSSLPYVAGPVS